MHRVLALIGVFFLASTLAAASFRASIVRVDPSGRNVIVEEAATAMAYELTSSRPIDGLRAGQAVTVDFTSRTLAAGNTHYTLTRAVGVNKSNLKLLSIDAERRLLALESVATGERLTLHVKPESLAQFHAGMVASSGVFGRWSADGRCACGQRTDGSCWCTSDAACCSPLHGCPIGSCSGGTNPTNDKLIFQTPGGGQKP
jgi:hypothetical protein